MHAQAQNKKIKNRRKRKTLRGKFNLNRHQLPFVLLAFPSFYLFICCYFFLFICCASLACIVYISLNGYLFAFYFYVRKQREIRLGLDFSVFLFLFFFYFALLLRPAPLPAPSSSSQYFSVAFCKCFLWGVENHFVKQTCSCSFSAQNKTCVLN